jgi:hypothetical protein
MIELEVPTNTFLGPVVIRQRLGFAWVNARVGKFTAMLDNHEVIIRVEIPP